MSRINTNVTSLVAQQRLGRNNSDLQTALARLSTGLRINSAKDDPAGLIASENLRRDITVTNKAITNSERASQLIATTEGALGQVSNLLNDIRGLVTEAANSGALSDDQIAANQLQVDSSLEAIDRISQVTTFQGARLLDGSMDFLTSAGVGFSTITDLNIDQANLGTTSSQSVAVDITQAAAKATITETGTPSDKATGQLQFGTGLISDTFNLGSVFRIESDLLGFAAGVELSVTGGASVGSEVASYDAVTGKLNVQIDAGATNATQFIAAINTTLGTQFTATISAGAGTLKINAADVTTGEFGTINYDAINITATDEGPDFNNVSIVVADGGASYGAPHAVYDSVSKTITVTIDETGDALADVAAAIDTDLSGTFDAAVSGATTGDGFVTASATGADFTATANTGTTGGAVLTDSVTFRISGELGSEVFSFASGATYSAIANAINSVTDATGVGATVETNGDLTLTSSGYGTDAVVDVEVIAEGVTGIFASGLSDTRKTGTDIAATINGVTAMGKANMISLNTSALDLSLSVTDGSTTDIAFTITDGGAIFQLGGQVVSNQQARLGIASIATARLGGATGRLFELAAGNARNLTDDTTGAAAIVDEVIDKISSLRGRLGAFERTTLETNIRSLQDTVANLVEAESAIRDADFAAESAALTRAQILVQSGTSVLAIANQNPQNVLALLG
jgi:flagellin